MKKTSSPPRRQTSLSRWLVLTVALAIAAVVITRSTSDTQNPPAPAETTPVNDQSVSAPRTISPRELTPVTAAVSARPAKAASTGPFEDRLIGGLEALEAEKDPVKREELLQAMVGSITPREAPAVLEMLQRLEPTEATKDMGLRLMRRWADSDPRAAADWAMQIPNSPLRAESLTQVAIAWANHDYAEAGQWARELDDLGERVDALRTVAYETVRTEPVEALRLAVELPGGPARDRLMRQATMEWAVRQPDDAVAWARQIPSSNLREQVLAGVAMGLGEKDPVAAGTLAAMEMAPGRLQTDAVVSIAQQWVQKEPEQAANWVERFPEGKLKLAAVDSIIAIWSLTDAFRAQEWKNNVAAANPPGE